VLGLFLLGRLGHERIELGELVLGALEHLGREHASASRSDVWPQRLLANGDDVFRTYCTDGRGVEALGSVWTNLDLTSLGRQEDREDSPESRLQTPPYQWWRRHDEYERDREGD
jgi:predicted dithiol-disulfide oxidoreductase (DUF899 family)